MKSVFFAIAALALIAPQTHAQDVQQAQQDLEILKGDVQKLQATQKPLRDARAAYEQAEEALKRNKREIADKAKAIRDGDEKARRDKEKLQKEANRTGGLVAHPELPGQLRDIDVAWEGAKKTLLEQKDALEAKRRQELQPAYEAARADKQAKELAHGTAVKTVEASARRFGVINCSAQSGAAARVTNGIGRAIKGVVSGLSEDCKEVREKIRGGLCKGGSLDVLLAQLGIDAKSKDCGPSSAGGTPAPADTDSAR